MAFVAAQRHQVFGVDPDVQVDEASVADRN